MHKIKILMGQKRYFLILLFLMETIFCIAYLAIQGNKPQIYTDIVVEYTSAFLANKSAELHVVYWMVFMSFIAYFIYFFLSKQYCKTVRKAEVESEKYLVGMFVLLSLVSYTVFSKTDITLLCFCLFLLYLFIFQKVNMTDSIISFWMIYYSLCGLYRIYVICGGLKESNFQFINIVTLALSCIVSILPVKKAVFVNLSLFMQFLILGLWFIFIQSSYKQIDSEGKIIISNKICPEKIVYIFVVCIILIFISALFLKFKQRRHCNIKDTITLGTCITIMAFNQFSGSGAVMSADMRHPYENVIGFRQIFCLGQVPFKEYVPVSGMYSVIHGAFLEFFGKGLFSNYYISTNIFYAFIIILIIFLLSKHLERIHVFFFSICISMVDYNRIVFVLPIMLLLTLNDLLRKPNLWFKIWILTSLFLGLYYPLVGVAVCVAFIPMAVVLLTEYIKTGELKKDLKTFKFYFYWGITFLPVILGMPWIIGLARQILAMSGQSIYADGLARFGQTLPPNFFSYINSDAIRMILYLLFSFLVPAILVFISFFLMMENVRQEETGGCLINEKKKAMAMIISVAIMMLITFSYTFIRLDINSIYSRHLGIMIAGGIMIILYSVKYVTDTENKVTVIFITLGIIATTSNIGFWGNDWKLRPYYKVPDGYISTDSGTVPNLGTGYFSKDKYDTLVQYKDNAEEYEKQYGLFAQYGPIYLYDIKGVSTIEAKTVRGYDAAKDTVQVLKDVKPVIGKSISSLDNYYLYHWLMTSGYYSFTENGGVYMPNDHVLNLELVAENNKKAGFQSEVYNLGNHASALGESMQELNKIFSDVTINYDIQQDNGFYEINFDIPIFGDQADFLYLKLDNTKPQADYLLYNTSDGFVSQDNLNRLKKALSKKVYNKDDRICLSWNINEKEYSVKCNFNKGELLIPLGSGANWLLYYHDNIRIIAERNGSSIPVPTILETRFLKLREVD